MEHVRSAFTQSDQTLWIAKNAKFSHARNEDSDQTARVCRLI